MSLGAVAALGQEASVGGSEHAAEPTEEGLRDLVARKERPCSAQSSLRLLVLSAARQRKMARGESAEPRRYMGRSGMEMVASREIFWGMWYGESASRSTCLMQVSQGTEVEVIDGGGVDAETLDEFVQNAEAGVVATDPSAGVGTG